MLFNCLISYLTKNLCSYLLSSGLSGPEYKMALFLSISLFLHISWFSPYLSVPAASATGHSVCIIYYTVNAERTQVAFLFIHLSTQNRIYSQYLLNKLFSTNKMFNFNNYRKIIFKYISLKLIFKSCLTLTPCMF